MKKFCIAALIGSMALLTLSCGDDKKTDDTSKCTQSKCDGTKLVTCNADGTTTTKDCGASGCDETKLTCRSGGSEETSKCTQSKCDGTKLVTCNADGTTTTKDCGTAGCDETKLTCRSGGSSSFQLVPVPENQNNTEGADCGDDFVEFCDGDDAQIYCGYFWNRQTEQYDTTKTVIREKCSDANDIYNDTTYKCSVWLDNGKNAVSCVEANDKDLCTKEGEVSYVCSYEFDYNIYEYVSIQYTTRCERFSDGKLHNTIVYKKFCSNICSEEDGCTTEKCTLPENDKLFVDKCDGDVAMFCTELEGEDSQYLVADCSIDGLTCFLDTYGEASCEDKK